ncbi:Venom serine protease 34, partial [Pseudolycoriella hygida]
MDCGRVFGVIVLITLFGLSHGYFESCDQTINIAAGQTLSVKSPGYSAGTGYVPGSSCRYTIVAPVDYQVRASCSMNMYDPSNGSCSSERFYFAIDGKKDLSTSTYYCGSKTVALTSIGNQMILAYLSYAYSGIFDCTITTVCDCGWSISSRIVGGTTASVNEFPPMAALSTITGTVKIYCGATI